MITAPVRLRCNDLVEPVGIDRADVHFSWQLNPRERRGLRQTSYRLQVASSPELLARDDPDFWDSGENETDLTYHVAYGGKALPSERKFYWRVRIRDEGRDESAWSRIATFVTGIGEWKAKWIEAPADERPTNFRWIWKAGEADPRIACGASTCRFVRTIEVPAGWKTEAAHALLLTPVAAYLQIGETRIDLKNSTALQKIVLPLSGVLTSISIVAEHNGDGPAAIAGRLVFHSADGRQMVVPLDNRWEVETEGTRESAIEVCQYGETDPSGNQITTLPAPQNDNGVILPPVRTFRRRFTVESPVREAQLHVTALGIVSVHINGAPISDDDFVPGWSDYQNRVYYRTIDVTSHIRTGENLIEVDLADGWYAGYVAWGHRRNHHRTEARVMAELVVVDSNGNTDRVLTNREWEVASDGPTVEADLLMGEYHDSRRIANNWASAELVYPEPVADIEPYPCEPVRTSETLTPIVISEPAPGQFVFDLGQNMVGVCRLRVDGPVGTKITLRFAEVLTDEGTVYTEALRGARSTDVFIKGIDGEETWTPRFTFHGFRYVQIAGLVEAPTTATVTGIVMHNGRSNAGDFTSSSELLNKLWSNIRWGWRGNSLDVPTDCPQRDERAGWTGDAFAFCRTATYLDNCLTFWRKWLDALFDGQLSEGFFPCVAPVIDISPNPVRHNAGWDDAAIMVPYTLWQMYGDLSHVRKHWDGMLSYMKFLESYCDDGIYPEAEIFGDWLNLNAPTPASVMGTAFYAQDAKQMSEMARAIGDAGCADALSRLYDRIRDRFVHSFVSPDGRIKGNTQTGYVLALRIGLVPDELKSAALEHLRCDLQYRSGSLSCGFMGLRDLLPALSDAGRDDLAYDLALRTEFPSWGNQIANGATTIWERWDGWTPEMGLQDPGMNSFNHYCFGAVGEWMAGYLGGIKPLAPGYRKLSIRPHLDSRITFLRSRVETPHGTASCAWSQRSGELTMVCRVPPNTTAELWVPCPEGAAPLESGIMAKTADGLEPLPPVRGYARYTAQPGHYSFRLT